VLAQEKKKKKKKPANATHKQLEALCSLFCSCTFCI